MCKYALWVSVKGTRRIKTAADKFDIMLPWLKLICVEVNKQLDFDPCLHRLTLHTMSNIFKIDTSNLHTKLTFRTLEIFHIERT